MLLGTMNDRRRGCDRQREHDGPGRTGTCAPPPPSGSKTLLRDDHALKKSQNLASGAMKTSGRGSATRETLLDSRALNHFLQTFFVSGRLTIVWSESDPCVSIG